MKQVKEKRSLSSLVAKESCISDNNHLSEKSNKSAKQGSDDAANDDSQCKTTALHFTSEEDRLLTDSVLKSTVMADGNQY